AFDAQGCTTAAHRLRLYGSGLPDLDSHSFESTAVVTPPAETDAPDEPAEGERTDRDTEPAPSNERPIQTPVPPGSESTERRPETPPGPNPDLNGAATHAAA